MLARARSTASAALRVLPLALTSLALMAACGAHRLKNRSAIELQLPTLTLRDGRELPVLALGVFRVPPGEHTYNAVTSALKLGYRHFDTAEGYHNELSVGRAIADSGIPREELWVTTKLSKMWRSNAVTYDVAMAELRASLKRLGMAYVDLYLIHTPADSEHRVAQWRALCDAKLMGLVRSIGVSDYLVAELEEIRLAKLEMPAVLQIEVNPWLVQVRSAVLQYAKEWSIVVEAWGALGVGAKFDDPKLLEVASHYRDRSVADVLLKWSLQMGFVPLVTSQSPGHQASNLALAADPTGWVLQAEDLALIDELKAEPFFTIGCDIIGEHGAECIS